MAEIKQDKPGITRYADHEVIGVPNRLKKKAVRQAATEEPDPLTDAEVALEELSSQFGGWMEDECRTLEEARQLVHREGLTEESRQTLFRAAHDIKGHGITFGYPMASDVADSLCQMIERAGAAPVPLTYIDKCVDSVRAIIREHDNENAGETAAALARELRTLTTELVGVEEKADLKADEKVSENAEEKPDEPPASPPLAPT
jgi:chemotaxis protein histidine kinase CheA